MRVLVCGSRTWDHPHIIEAFVVGLNTLTWWESGEFVLIHGDAKGADQAAAATVENESIATIEAYPADWDTHGKAAGPIRNQQMLDEGKPDLVLAFVDKPLADSRGTADMVRRAKQAGVPTYVIEKVR